MADACFGVSVIMYRHRWITVAAVAVIGGVLGSCGGGTGRGASHRGLVFTSDSGGHPDLYVVAVDGSGRHRLVSGFDEAQYPAASPDGRRVAFQASLGGNVDIYSVNSDGSGLRRLTTDTALDEAPSWSPDGRSIAFDRVRSGSVTIWTMSAEGTHQRQVTHDPFPDITPVWSPDASRIAFAAERSGASHIYVIGADGQAERQLTAGTGDDQSPAWSPDGRRIAFDRDRDGIRDVYVVNADGSGVRQLTSNAGCNHFASWSPDGTRIAYTTNRDSGADPACAGGWQIYTMTSAGTDHRLVTASGAFDFTAAGSWGIRLEPPSAPITTASPGQPPTTTPATVTPGSSAYFLRPGTSDQPGPLLTPVWVPGATTPRAALEALLAGPPSQPSAVGSLRLHTDVTKGTQLLSLDVGAAVATIDLAGPGLNRPTSGASPLADAEAAQVVFTLTQFPDIQRVAFRLDGRPVSNLGGNDISNGIGWEFFATSALVPQIFVDQPAAGQPIRSPFLLSGLAHGVATDGFNYEITTPTEDVIAQGTITTSASSASGVRTFHQQLTFPIDGRQALDLNVFAGDATSAHVEALLQVPLTTPRGEDGPTSDRRRTRAGETATQSAHDVVRPASSPCPSRSESEGLPPLAAMSALKDTGSRSMAK